jgi:hypothetical protein
MAQTLAQIMQMLPDIGQQRLTMFNPDFWVRVGNQVLFEVETKVTGPEMEIEAALALIPKRTLYPIPPSIRKVTRLRFPNVDGVMDTREELTQINFDIQDSFLMLKDPTILPSESDVITLTQELASDYIVSATPLTGADANEYLGRACMVYHANAGGIAFSPATAGAEWRLCADINPTIGKLYLNGPTRRSIAVADTIVTTKQYLIVEGRKRLSRFVDMDSQSPLPDEWDHIIIKGIRYYMEVQSDEEGAGASANAWQTMYLDAMREYSGDASLRQGDVTPVMPRSGGGWGQGIGGRRG